MIPIISQNKWNDSNIKERDPLLRPYNHLTGEPLQPTDIPTLEEVIECHEDLMAGDSNHGK